LRRGAPSNSMRGRQRHSEDGGGGPRAHMIICETARLHLRELHDGDASFVLELYTDPDFLANIGDRGVHNAEDARRYIAQGPGKSYERYGFGLWVMERKSDAMAVGMCGLLRRDTHPDVELGFAMLPRFRRMGYTREAARATVQVGAQRFGLTRIVALAVPDNRASIGLLEQLGFSFERLVRYTPDGESRLLARDCRPLAPSR
jgi:[ribosomal protein S5]-alanine N-acetyltransferase